MSHLDFDIPDMEFTLDVSSLAFLSGDIRISSLGYINSTNSYVRIYKPFMQNKANFRNDQMCANLFTTRDYEENGHSGHQKTNPIAKSAKMNPFAWVWSLK